MDRAIVALLAHSFNGRLHSAVLDSNFPLVKGPVGGEGGGKAPLPKMGFRVFRPL
jgi:hypothetical protein